jgi:hypothetical protein
VRRRQQSAAWQEPRAVGGIRLTRILRVSHDSQVTDLTTLTGRWWDWEVSRWDAAGPTLVADNDLTYHWNVEVSFVGSPGSP